MDGIAKLFEQSNPLAWVIGAITVLALALILSKTYERWQYPYHWCT
jgi:uncharacterized membrane protein YeiB